MLDNPYYFKWKAAMGIGASMKTQRHMYRYRKRDELVREYAWAVPNENAIKSIANFTDSIVEIGAGSGYWAWLLRQAGVHVRPYDNNKRTEYIGKRWVRVFKGDSTSVRKHKDRALMLCWPEYDDPQAYDSLRFYKGDKVIYAGEGGYGCNACSKFHESISDNWTEMKNVMLPQWDGIHDNLRLFSRN